MAYRTRKTRRLAQNRKFLRVEPLEERNMFSTVTITTTAVVGGIDLSLSTPSASNCSLEIQSGSSPNSLVLTPLGNTYLQQGANQASQNPVTLNGINGTVTLDLSGGDQTIQFLAPTGGGTTLFASDLDIETLSGADTVSFSNVQVNGDFTMDGTDATGPNSLTAGNFLVLGDVNITNGSSSGSNTFTSPTQIDGDLTIKSSADTGPSTFSATGLTVLGSTLIDNEADGNEGDSPTTIVNSKFDGSDAAPGSPGTPAFELLASAGDAQFQASGTTSFGSSVMPPTADGLYINNDVGGVLTTQGSTTGFGSAGNSATIPLMIWGNAVIMNGPVQVGSNQLNLTSFNWTEIENNLTINNPDAAAGSSAEVTEANTYVQGNVNITNGYGYDTLLATGSYNPYLYVYNDNSAATPSNQGSYTNVTTSNIGTLHLGGDNGANVVTVSKTVVDNLDVNLANANDNTVTLDSNYVTNLLIDTTANPTGAGNQIFLKGGYFADDVQILLALPNPNPTVGTTGNTLTLTTGTAGTGNYLNLPPFANLVQPPTAPQPYFTTQTFYTSPFGVPLSVIDIDLGLGVNTLNYSASLGIVLPPNITGDTIVNKM